MFSYLLSQPEIDSLRGELEQMESALKNQKGRPERPSSLTLKELRLKADMLCKPKDKERKDIKKIKKQLKALVVKNNLKKAAQIKYAEDHKISFSVMEGFDPIEQIGELLKIVKLISKKL